VTRKGWNGRAPAGRIAYVDGRYLPHGRAGVHIEDRGLQLADAIYEVCAISDGLLIDLEEHLDRMVRSLGEIGMAMPMPISPNERTSRSRCSSRSIKSPSKIAQTS